MGKPSIEAFIVQLERKIAQEFKELAEYMHKVQPIIIEKLNRGDLATTELRNHDTGEAISALVVYPARVHYLAWLEIEPPYIEPVYTPGLLLTKTGAWMTYYKRAFRSGKVIIYPGEVTAFSSQELRGLEPYQITNKLERLILQ